MQNCTTLCKVKVKGHMVSNAPQDRFDSHPCIHIWLPVSPPVCPDLLDILLIPQWISHRTKLQRMQWNVLVCIPLYLQRVDVHYIVTNQLVHSPSAELLDTKLESNFYDLASSNLIGWYIYFFKVLRHLEQWTTTKQPVKSKQTMTDLFTCRSGGFSCLSRCF